MVIFDSTKYVYERDRFKVIEYYVNSGIVSDNSMIYFGHDDVINCIYTKDNKEYQFSEDLYHLIFTKDSSNLTEEIPVETKGKYISLTLFKQIKICFFF